MGSPLRVPILGGINSYDSEDSLEQGQVVTASNFLWEGKLARTRPGVQATTLFSPGLGASAQILHARYFPKIHNTTTGPGAGFLITADGNVWSFSAGSAYENGVLPLSVAPLTGSPVSASYGGGINSGFAPDSIAVNNVVLFSTTNGVYRWDPTTVIITNLGFGTYAYLTSLLGRAIAARLEGGLPNPLKVAWSATGDETNWTTLDSGTATLQEAVDQITGLGTLQNVIVILRSTGIHFGTPTGVAPPNGPSFRFETFTRDGIGCYYQGTGAFANNMGFFVGSDDVYMLTLQQITPIGKEIRKLLFAAIKSLRSYGLFWSYLGFISIDHQEIEQFGQANNRGAVLPSRIVDQPRLRYHLVPAANLLLSLGFSDMAVNLRSPHFVYDLLEEKWSVHRYDFPFGGGFDMQGPVLYDTGIHIFPWDDNLPQEAGAYILGPVLPIEQVEHNYRVERVLLRYKNFGKTEGIQSTLSAAVDNVREATIDSQLFGADPIDESWMRQYFNHRLVGQDFQWRLDIPPGVKFATNYMSMPYTDAGIFRGVPPPQ